MALDPNMNGRIIPGTLVGRETEPQPSENTSSVMRLNYIPRPLQNTYLSNGEISENDADVQFICSDGLVKAHKIILASSSMFFINLFENQLSTEMTTVIVPDISSRIIRLILSLSYKENITMNHNEVKQVAEYLNLFGMNLKQFHCNDATNPDSIVDLNIQIKTPQQPYPPQRQQEQIQQQPSQKYQQQNQAKLQEQKGKVIVKSPSSRSMVFISRTNQSLSKPQNTALLMHKPANQNQLVGPVLYGSGDGPNQVQNCEPGQGQRQREQLVQNKDLNKLQPQQIQVKQVQQLLSGGHVQQIQENEKVNFPEQQASGENIPDHRRITPKPMSHSDGEEIDLYGGVSDQMEIQMETGDSNEEDNVTVDPQSGQIMIQECAQNMGCDNTSSLPKKSVSSEIKPTAAAGSSRTSIQTQPGTSRSAASTNQCLFCSNIFEDENKWHWHETHHVDQKNFKCAYCDELFSTSYKVYQHEMMEHGVVTANDNPIEPPTISEDFQIVNGRKRRLLEHGTHLPELPATQGPTTIKEKIVISDHTNLSINLNPNHSQIEVGDLLEEVVIEEKRKPKQVHWIHVCSKCNHVSDLKSKAQVHYKNCYPDVEVPFVSSFVRHRLGFFGNIKCPICPRHYTSSTGFITHCRQIHGDYHKKFQYTRTDDSITCRHCHKKFKDLVDFHYHLSHDDECKGKNCNSVAKLKKKRISRVASTSTITSTSSSSSINNLTSMIPHSSSSFQRNNKILMKSKNDESRKNKYPPVTCPVCGIPSIEKIVQHLQIEHSDLDILVSRLRNGSLRCQNCRIAFTLCNLLRHIDNCKGKKQSQYVNEYKDGQSGSKSCVSGPIIEGTTSITIPLGIGCSPIDVIECKDLISVETLKAAKHCGVCGTEANKFGIIADCLRSHGIHRCPICFNTYKDKQLYGEHLRQAHKGGEGKLSCPICSETFTKAGQVAGHMYLTHWLKLLQDKDIIDKNNLQSKN